MKKFALINNNIKYSSYPVLYKKIFEFYNFENEYHIFNLENSKQIKSCLKELKNNNFLGINIIAPYRNEILKYVDTISPEVESIGAANCIKLESNKAIAYNTDYFGLLKTFKKMNLNLKNKKVVVIGNDELARATIKALIDSLAIIYTVYHDIESTKNNFLNTFDLSYENLKSHSGYLIINTTQIGAFPDINSSPVSSDIVQNFDFVLDLVYNPRETLFLKHAKSKGKITENGLYMLVAQIVKSQEILNNKNYNYEKIYDFIQKII